MCSFKLMAFACLVAAAAAVAADLPAGAKNPAAQDVGNYTVLYDGPDGSHLQTGEPGKAVKGFYTFFDSRGRKQKVTYEADERGYRVTSAAVVATESAAQIPVTTRRPRIIEKIVPKLQGGVFFTKKVNEARSELREQSTVRTTSVETPQSTSKPNPVTTSIPTLKEAEKEIIHLKTVPKSQIKFKEPRALLNYDFAYNLGYPYVAGIYVYAL